MLPEEFIYGAFAPPRGNQALAPKGAAPKGGDAGAERDIQQMKAPDFK
jgi:hypothetical protein